MRHIRAGGLLFAMLLAPFVMSGRDEPTVEELKVRVANADIPDRPPLCIRIMERQLDGADKLLIAGDSEKAKIALLDVVAFAELARDYAVQSHRHEKQCEIAIRRETRKLADLKHMVSHDDQDLIQNAVDRLQRVRDDLLVAMFPKVGKK